MPIPKERALLHALDSTARYKNPEVAAAQLVEARDYLAGRQRLQRQASGERLGDDAGGGGGDDAGDDAPAAWEGDVGGVRVFYRTGGRRKKTKGRRRRRNTRKQRRRHNTRKQRRRRKKRTRRRHYRGGATCTVKDSIKSIATSPARGFQDLKTAWVKTSKAGYNLLTPGCPPNCTYPQTTK